MGTIGVAFLTLVLIVILLFIVKEDFQKRTIHIGWLLALGILGGIYGWQLADLDLFSVGLNIGFVLLQLLLLSLYFSIKNRRWINIADTLLGWGDIIFFFLLCLILPPLELVWFYTLSLLTVLVGFLIYKIKNTQVETIPLAGGMSICLIAYLIWQWVF